jgi:hypothetical protein
VPGLSSTTAAGLARRLSDGQWRAVETGIGDVHTAMLAALSPQRVAALCETVTIDLDTTDVEVYGRKKRGVAYNYLGQRCGRPHVATWAETATALAATPRACWVAPWRRCLLWRGPGGCCCALTPGTSPGSWPAPR